MIQTQLGLVCDKETIFMNIIYLILVLNFMLSLALFFCWTDLTMDRESFRN